MSTTSIFNEIQTICTYTFTPCLKKPVQNCFFVRTSSNIHQYIDNFWQEDGKEAKIMQGALISHLN